MTTRVACIGAGTVGRAWAVVFARAGHSVALYDTDPEQGTRALAVLETTLQQLQAAGQLHEAPSSVLDRVQIADSLAAAVSQATHIQESVREDLALKRSVAAEIAAQATPEAVIASSTSALPGSDFLTDIAGPGRALVAHPVNPPSLIPLVELCGTTLTDPETVEATRRFMDTLGMKPVVLKREIDGFLLNRLQYTLVAEALHLVGEGYCAAEDIDRVMTEGLALRWLSIGPFATAHLNASDGFAGFVAQLGPMMRRMGLSARTDYEWDDALVAQIHEDLAERMPVSRIADWQRWRDGRILAARHTQIAGAADQPERSGDS